MKFSSAVCHPLQFKPHLKKHGILSLSNIKLNMCSILENLFLLVYSALYTYIKKLYAFCVQTTVNVI